MYLCNLRIIVRSTSENRFPLPQWHSRAGYSVIGFINLVYPLSLFITLGHVLV